MNIDGRGMKRFMSKQSLNSEQVGAIFIEMSSKSVTEGMAVKAMLPSESVFMLMDMT